MEPAKKAYFMTWWHWVSPKPMRSEKNQKQYINQGCVYGTPQKLKYYVS